MKTGKSILVIKNHYFKILINIRSVNLEDPETRLFEKVGFLGVASPFFCPSKLDRVAHKTSSPPIHERKVRQVKSTSSDRLLTIQSVEIAAQNYHLPYRF